ncbi:hypothetical protein Scep_019385 [Stephania cephalantha]|uniref:CAP-Gly domain-containing protein n=1 Tax=Stephania cephalantha TaxID=152367 RepID=A0AAP0NPS6_9MAGN
MQDMEPELCNENSEMGFAINQRVHSVGDPRRTGTVKYIGPVKGFAGIWVGIDWDNGEGKHDGSINGVRYFEANNEKSGSFVRRQNLSKGISFLEALELRYRGSSSKEEEDEMYVLSAGNKRVFVQLVGKNKVQDKFNHFEELVGVSLSYMGISSVGSPKEIEATVPNIKQLDLTGNLFSNWEDVDCLCEGLQKLEILDLTKNLLSHYVMGLMRLKNVRVLVLNSSGINWAQIERLNPSLEMIEELHLMGNKLKTIVPASSNRVQGFISLRLLNLEDNLFNTWDEILKLSWLRSLEQLQLNKNHLSRIFYPDHCSESSKPHEKGFKPFNNLRCLLLGDNKIADLPSVDCLNYFPNLTDIRLSGNPITDQTNGGIPRFVLIARLEKVQILNGSEVSSRERKESEIRYVRYVITQMQDRLGEIAYIHPRFDKLKALHGIEDEKSSNDMKGPQKMASGLLSITLKSCGASMGEKPPVTKKIPATTIVGKLKVLCESFFKLKGNKLKLFLVEEDSPFPVLLVDDMASLVDLGIINEATIIIDHED